MKNLKYIFLLAISAFILNGCSEEEEDRSSANYVTFETSTFDFPINVGTTVTGEIKIFSAIITGSARTFDISVNLEATTADPVSYIVPTTVTIPANSSEGMIEVSVSDVNIGLLGETLVIDLIPTSGLYVGEAITLNISQVCDFPVVLDILFDGYASESDYEISNASGSIVATGGGWADGLTSFSKSLCLADGTYTFTITDSYGDGLSYPADGSATITQNGVELATVSGDFGYAYSMDFTVSN
jgi:hypothetical protein